MMTKKTVIIMYMMEILMGLTSYRNLDGPPNNVIILGQSNDVIKTSFLILKTKKELKL